MNQQEKTVKRPACDGCKMYRVKCAKEGASCRNCNDLKLKCTYTVVPKKRGPKIGYKRNKEVDTNNSIVGEFVMYEADTTNEDIVLVEKVGSPKVINEADQSPTCSIPLQNHNDELMGFSRESSLSSKYNKLSPYIGENTAGSLLLPSISSGTTISPYLFPMHLTPEMAALNLSSFDKVDEFVLDSNQITGSYEETNFSFNSLGYLNQQDTGIPAYNPINTNFLNPQQDLNRFAFASNTTEVTLESNFTNAYSEEYQLMLNNVIMILNSYAINGKLSAGFLYIILGVFSNIADVTKLGYLVEKLNQYLSGEPNFPSIFTELILYNLASLGCTLQHKLNSVNNHVEQAKILECEIARRTCILPQTMLDFEKNEFSIYINNLAYDI